MPSYFVAVTSLLLLAERLEIEIMSVVARLLAELLIMLFGERKNRKVVGFAVKLPIFLTLADKLTVSPESIVAEVVLEFAVKPTR